MIDPYLTQTYVDVLDIVTVCTVTGRELDRHTIPEKVEVFAEDIIDALIRMIFERDLVACRFKVSRTPFVIQKERGGLSVYVQANRPLYDLFLYVADLMQFEFLDVGDMFRFIGWGEWLDYGK